MATTRPNFWLAILLFLLPTAAIVMVTGVWAIPRCLSFFLPLKLASVGNPPSIWRIAHYYVYNFHIYVIVKILLYQNILNFGLKHHF